MAATITIHYKAVVQGRWRQTLKIDGKLYPTCDCRHGHGNPGEATGCATSRHNSARILSAKGEGGRALTKFLQTYEIERVEDG
jgi:hypothetical protein